MTQAELKERMTSFGVNIIKMVNIMPNSVAGLAIAKQIVRSGTSPSANYRAACLAKSDKDFVNKLKMVEEELDETCHWLEMIMRSALLPTHYVNDLLQEGMQLTNIIAKSIVTTKARMAADETAKKK